MTVTSFAKLPLSITVGAGVSFMDSTIVSPSESDVNRRRDLRLILRQFSCPMVPSDAEEIQSIIMSHRRRYPFAARNWMNYQFTNEVMASQSTTIFKFQKVWQPSTGGRSQVERILIIDESEVDVLVKVNNATVTNWDFVDYGKIEFDAPLNPMTDEVTSSGQFLTAVTIAEPPQADILRGDLFQFKSLMLNEIPEAELIRLLA